MKFNGFYDGVDNGHPARDPYMREALRSVNGALKRYKLALPDTNSGDPTRFATEARARSLAGFMDPDPTAHGVPPYNGVQAYCDYNAARTE